ncbi:MAG TPA: hypothetical protein VHC21_04635 [Candidatus Saccharimonadales bacterium]|nr:hypothetical protein [Candidatus Saccharimonadales bacterium]
MVEKNPGGFDEEFLANYVDPYDVDLAPDDPLLQVYQNRQIQIPADYQAPQPGEGPSEFRRVKLENGDYVVIQEWIV